MDIGRVPRTNGNNPSFAYVLMFASLPTMQHISDGIAAANRVTQHAVMNNI